MDFVKIYSVQPQDLISVNAGTPYLKNIKIISLTEYKAGKFVSPALKYFKEPTTKKYPLDLNKNFENYKFRSEDYCLGTIPNVETFLMNNNSEAKEFLGRSGTRTRICLNRSVLHGIMGAPYSKSRHSCHISAVKVNDIIFITPGYKGYKQCKDPISTYHFKFVQYCFSDSPDEEPNTDKAVNENDQIYGIYHAGIGNFDLLFSAEINGIMPSQGDVDKSEYGSAELNSYRFVYTKLLSDHLSTREWKRHPKMFGFWIKAYLTNVNDLYVGFRTNSGIVKDPIQHVFVEDLAKNQYWNPKVCAKFLNTFLTLVDNKMQGAGDPTKTFEFKYNTSAKAIEYRVQNDLEPFLSERFISFLQEY